MSRSFCSIFSPFRGCSVFSVNKCAVVGQFSPVCLGECFFFFQCCEGVAVGRLPCTCDLKGRQPCFLGASRCNTGFRTWDAVVCYVGTLICIVSFTNAVIWVYLPLFLSLWFLFVLQFINSSSLSIYRSVSVSWSCLVILTLNLEKHKPLIAMVLHLSNL